MQSPSILSTLKADGRGPSAPAIQGPGPQGPTGTRTPLFPRLHPQMARQAGPLSSQPLSRPGLAPTPNPARPDRRRGTHRAVGTPACSVCPGSGGPGGASGRVRWRLRRLQHPPGPAPGPPLAGGRGHLRPGPAQPHRLRLTQGDPRVLCTRRLKGTIHPSYMSS